MAHPVIVAGATAESGAALGPVEYHGMRPYRRTARGVKIVRRRATLSNSTSIDGRPRGATPCCHARADLDRASTRMMSAALAANSLGGSNSLQFYETFRSDRLSSVNHLKQQIKRSGCAI